MEDRIAIILVNYNGWKDTIECLYSLEKVNYKNFEVVVVDNASTDKSVEELIKYGDNANIQYQLIVEKENLGFAGGNNVGIRYALKQNFSYFLMLNNDTLVDSDFLNELLKPFKNNKVGATIGEIYYAFNPRMIWYAGGEIDKRSLKPSHDRFKEIEDEHKSEIRQVSFATGCCLFCSKECLEKTGLWSEDYFLYEEDVDLSLRILQANFLIVYNSDAIIYHKVSASTGKTNGFTEIYQIRNRLWLIEKYMSGISKILAYFYTVLMALNRVRKKEYSLRPMLEGIRAFTRGEKGRHKG